MNSSEPSTWPVRDNELLSRTVGLGKPGSVVGWNWSPSIRVTVVVVKTGPIAPFQTAIIRNVAIGWVILEIDDTEGPVGVGAVVVVDTRGASRLNGFGRSDSPSRGDSA